MYNQQYILEDFDNTVDATSGKLYAQTYHIVYKHTYNHSPDNNSNDEKTSTYIMAGPTIIPGSLSPSSYDLSNYNSSSSNNCVGNNLLSISNTESNTVAMAAPTGMVEPYNMTYNTTVLITYKAASSVARTTTLNESRSVIYNEDSSAGNDSPVAVTMKTYNTVYNL